MQRQSFAELRQNEAATSEYRPASHKPDKPHIRPTVVVAEDEQNQERPPDQ
jgi:hypothetical protein